MGTHFEHRAEVLKADESLGLVFGWAIICTEGGEPYFDTQGDHIPPEAMLKSMADFMATSKRESKEQHNRPDAGQVVFAFPLTADVQKALGIQCDKTGALIAVRADAEMLAKVKSGELTGFSIGGFRGVDQDVDD